MLQVEIVLQKALLAVLVQEWLSTAFRPLYCAHNV